MNLLTIAQNLVMHEYVPTRLAQPALIIATTPLSPWSHWTNAANDIVVISSHATYGNDWAAGYKKNIRVESLLTKRSFV